MNTYLVASSLDEFGSYEETRIEADYVDFTPDGILRLYVKDTFDTVALFARGFWSRVTKENK